MTFAYVTVWLFTLVYFARPGDWVDLPFAQIVGVFVILAFLGGLLSGALPALWWSRDVVLMLLLFAQICLCVPFSIWPGGSFQVAEEFAKITVVTLTIIMASNSLARLRHLIYIQTAAVMIMAVLVAAGYGGTLEGAVGSRAVNVVSGVFNNPNELALALALIFPFAFAFAVRADNLLWKLVWIVAMLVAIYISMTTYSRSGLLALLAAATISFWELAMKRRRLRWAFLFGVSGLAVILVGSPSGLGQRMATIFQPDADVTGSSEQRHELLIRSLEVTAEHPLVGVGPGNFVIVSGFWKVTHNSYTQLSAEAGLPALFLFLLLGRRSFSNLRLAQLDPNNQELSIWATSLRASLAALAVGAFFSSIAFHYFPYFLIGYTGALYRVSQSGCLARHPISDSSLYETLQPVS